MKIVVVAGTRPNFMKISPVMKAISIFNESIENSTERLSAFLVHTGQHYDKNMSNVFFKELGIRPPDFNLEVGSGTHAVQTAKIMMGFEALCAQEKPDWVVVVGDVNSTMACALVCSKMGIRIAHIEAGLRSFDRTMPEEINRLVTDALADLLLTPSSDADNNLIHEGVPKEKIRLVGNIMIDSLLDNLDKARALEIIPSLGLTRGQFVYITLHRPSNVDAKASLTAIMAEMERISHRLPVVFPVHPRTRKMLIEFDLIPLSNERLKLLDPIGYHESLCFAENSRLIITDSGGLQEEATFFMTPCLTLRPSTERPITIALGSNRLTTLEMLGSHVQEALDGPERIGQVPPLWDGHTATRSLREILRASFAN